MHKAVSCPSAELFLPQEKWRESRGASLRLAPPGGVGPHYTQCACSPWPAPGATADVESTFHIGTVSTLEVSRPISLNRILASLGIVKCCLKLLS